MKLKSWGFEKHDANEATISQNSITFDPMSSVVLNRSKSEEVQWQASPMVSSSSAKSQFVGNSAILNAATTFQNSRAKDYFPKAESDDLPLVPEVNKASALPPRSSIAQSSFVQGIPGVRNNGMAREPLGPARWSCIYIVFAPYLTLSFICIIHCTHITAIPLQLHPFIQLFRC